MTYFLKNLHVGLECGLCPSLNKGLYSGSTLFDLSVNSYDGTLVNAEPEDWEISEGLHSIRLDGVDEYISVPPITLDGESWSVSFWANLSGWSGVGNPGVFRDNNVFGGGTFAIFRGTTGLPWIRRNGTNVMEKFSGTPFPTGSWSHVVFLCTPTTAEMWINGILEHATTHSVAGAPFTIYGLGRQQLPAESLQGLVDDFLIYSRMLAPVEISTLSKYRGIVYDQAGLAGIVEKFWKHHTRELDPGSPAASDGSYLDDIGYEIWSN